MATPREDLKAHAASSQDFYALLDIPPTATESEIRRGYRRAALKYHPDKIAHPTPADIDKFHLLQIAYDVLSDPTVRQLYDNAREARERKKREREAMDAAKRKMREELEARERAAGENRGVKRPWMATAMSTDYYDEEAERKLEREIERIAEDGRRRRREAEERRMREALEEEERLAREEEEARKQEDRAGQKVDRSKEGGQNVPELERAVKVRWIREGPGADLDKDGLQKLFSPFGTIESTFLLKDRRQRVGPNREKKTVATGVVVYTSIVGAHAAVLDSEKKLKTRDGVWSVIESVFWASGDEPDLGPPRAPETPSSTPSTPTSTISTTSATATAAAANGQAPKKPPAFDFSSLKDRPASSGKTPGKGPPSFSSFASAAAANAAKATTTGGSSEAESKPTLTTPSLEEVTLMRLRNAQREKERRALEEQLRKEDEAADAADGTVS
ncbi:hypothetical protein VTN49DRAFT_3176 [Thermomyces lanuginosus]|uniref:uncharacterized protein n=1 Tax=Thermomyces lanuginosus TaxID=5541 RepID=UPI003743DA91